MLNSYKFKFVYERPGLKSKGNGTCKAEDISDAKIVAENGVAQDFGGNTNDVVIVSITKVKTKQRGKSREDIHQ